MFLSTINGFDEYVGQIMKASWEIQDLKKGGE